VAEIAPGKRRRPSARASTFLTAPSLRRDEVGISDEGGRICRARVDERLDTFFAGFVDMGKDLFHLPARVMTGILVGALLAGCQGRPVSYVALTPRPIGDSYTCSFRLVNERGYTVTNADRAAAFIAAEKHRNGVMQTILAREEVDRLTIAIYGDSASQQSRMRLTVSATRLSQSETGSRQESINPSDAAIADAQAVLARCAE
jgi:hypothetical protein